MEPKIYLAACRHANTLAMPRLTQKCYFKYSTYNLHFTVNRVDYIPWFPGFFSLNCTVGIGFFMNSMQNMKKTIYRAPGFLAVVWFGSSPTPSSSPVSKLNWRHRGRLKKWANLLTGEEWKGVGEESIHNARPQESLALYKLFNTLCCSRSSSVCLLCPSWVRWVGVGACTLPKPPI